MFLLDTNVISELRKTGDGKADANVVAWLSGVDAATCHLSAVTRNTADFESTGVPLLNPWEAL